MLERRPGKKGFFFTVLEVVVFSHAISSWVHSRKQLHNAHKCFDWSRITLHSDIQRYLHINTHLHGLKRRRKVRPYFHETAGTWIKALLFPFWANTFFLPQQESSADWRETKKCDTYIGGNWISQGFFYNFSAKSTSQLRLICIASALTYFYDRAYIYVQTHSRAYRYIALTCTEHICPLVCVYINAEKCE